jgi:hypothetical protein
LLLKFSKKKIKLGAPSRLPQRIEKIFIFNFSNFRQILVLTSCF